MIEITMWDNGGIETGGIYPEQSSVCLQKDDKGWFGCKEKIQWGYYDKRNKEGYPIARIKIPLVLIRGNNQNGHWENHWIKCPDKIRMRKYFDELKTKKNNENNNKRYQITKPSEISNPEPNRRLF